MREKIRNLLLYAGADRSSIARIMPSVQQANVTMALTLSGFGTLLIAAMLVFSLRLNGLRQNSWVYVGGLCFSVLIFLLSFVAKKHPKLIIPLIYLAYSVYYLYGILIGLVTDANSKTVTYIAMLILVPSLFVQRPLRMIVLTCLFDAIFIVGCVFIKSGSVMSVDIVNGALFGLLGLASGLVNNQDRVRHYIDVQKLQEISRIDKLTGVNNRNAYEVDLFSFAEKCKHNLACIYVDVNGLHELNNKKGHEHGDLMLKFIAKQIKITFSEGMIYRTGGDEFVVFLPDTSKADVGYDLINLIKKVEAEGYYIAVGYDVVGLRNLLVDDLVKSAEMNMFMNKNEYYKNLARTARKENY